MIIFLKYTCKYKQDYIMEYTMPVSDARRRANEKWLKEKVEDIRFRVPMGRKSIIQAHAKKRGESVNAFINRAVNETIERDGD